MKLAWPIHLVVALALSFGAGELHAQEKTKVLKEDVLAFRVQTRQVFLSNLKVYLTHLKDFHCLFPDSRLLKISGANYKDVVSVQNKSVSDVQKSPEQVEKLMNLILSQVYTNSLQLSLERNFDLGLPLEKCKLGRFGSWNNELKSLVQAELYMREGSERPSRFTQKARQRYYQMIDEKMDYEFYL